MILRLSILVLSAAMVMILTGIEASRAEPVAAVVRDPGLGKGMQDLDFEVGRALFEQQWVSAPSSTQATDGLGPLFNARSCHSCHAGGGRGIPFDQNGALTPSLLVKLGMHGSAMGDPIYGRQIQTNAVPGLNAEAKVEVSFAHHTVTLADGSEVDLEKPILHLADFAFGPLATDTQLSPRLATAINGIGLLERIPDAEILERTKEAVNGVSGRPNWIVDPATGKRALGRFGWKASEASLETQDAKALDLDIGLSNPLYRDAYGDCTKAETACLKMPNGASPQFENLEVPSVLMNLIDRFVREAVLPKPKPADVSGLDQGKTVFASAGCEACHRAQFHLPASGKLAARDIAPYSDLLLHDMGTDLADHVGEGAASGKEWRTAPLWGVGTAMQRPGAGLMHDGRARTILEAILWHDGEAATARRKVEALSPADRQALIDFVGSL
ncbi:MAG TPA: di-heme oxidoredictase family protein [Dongiaceae bacterium]